MRRGAAPNRQTDLVETSQGALKITPLFDGSATLCSQFTPPNAVPNFYFDFLRSSFRTIRGADLSQMPYFVEDFKQGARTVGGSSVERGPAGHSA